MAYLLDTCTISELGKAKPNLKVKDALLALPRDELHLSAISLGELQYGIQLQQNLKEKARLSFWLETSILAVFGERIIAIDSFVAICWGGLFAVLKEQGLKMQVQDALIAATALEYGMTLVTRNESDFKHAGVKVLNPWK